MTHSMKALCLALGIALAANTALANQKRIVYTTTIDGKKYELLTNSFENSKHRETLKMLEQAMAENNRLTAQYLKTKSPAWKDLMTDEMKANNAKFRQIWKRIVIERHYNKDVLDAYEKYGAVNLANWDKMYAHFYSLSTNEPFKEKVRKVQQSDKNHFLNDRVVIEHLRTYL